jgi:hypothetical protein
MPAVRPAAPSVLVDKALPFVPAPAEFGDVVGRMLPVDPEAPTPEPSCEGSGPSEGLVGMLEGTRLASKPGVTSRAMVLKPAAGVATTGAGVCSGVSWLAVIVVGTSTGTN